MNFLKLLFQGLALFWGGALILGSLAEWLTGFDFDWQFPALMNILCLGFGAILDRLDQVDITITLTKREGEDSPTPEE